MLVPACHLAAIPFVILFRFCCPGPEPSSQMTSRSPFMQLPHVDQYGFFVHTADISEIKSDGLSSGQYWRSPHISTANFLTHYFYHNQNIPRNNLNLAVVKQA